MALSHYNGLANVLCGHYEKIIKYIYNMLVKTCEKALKRMAMLNVWKVG